MDYNANINWIVAGQLTDRRLNVIKSFYVRFERLTTSAFVMDKTNSLILKAI